VVVHDAASAATEFDRLVASCDHTLLIAPETDAVLQRLAARVASSGRLLSPSADAIACCSDKYQLSRLLAEAGVPTPVTSRLEEVRNAQSGNTERFAFPLIVKPIDGAGSDGCRLVDNPADLERLHGSGLVAQPLVAGRAVSVCLLCAGSDVECLVAGEQQLGESFAYLGGAMPLRSPWQDRAFRLARAGVECVAKQVGSIHGLIGVDLVLSDDPAGRGDCLIEINPRLTTSYVGLRYLSRTNLADAMLRAAEGQMTSVVLKNESVKFNSDGLLRGCQAAT